MVMGPLSSKSRRYVLGITSEGVYPYTLDYRISSVIRREFFIPKRSQRDGSRFSGLFWKRKSHLIYG